MMHRLSDWKIYRFFVMVFLGVSVQMAVSSESSANENLTLAKNYYRLGKMHFSKKEYVKALEMFQYAFKITSRNELLFNIALCYEGKGELKNALKYLRQYRKLIPGDKNQVNSRIIDIYRRLKSTYVELNGGISGSEIFINGISAGKLPEDKLLKVAPDREFVLEVNHSGYTRFVRKLKVTPGTIFRVDVRMNPQKVKTPGLKITQDNKSSLMPAYLKVGLFTLVPAVVAVVTGVQALKWNSEVEKLNEEGLSSTSAEKKAMYYAVATDILGLSSAALAVWTVYLFTTGDKKTPSVVPSVGIDGHGAVFNIGGRF
ncbi:MAG: hypothetical protein JXR95_01240 [Deltaproteobacteria bacterium]|nr:hypothetical protein [Deltaproteobacteria bacterium]